MNRVLAPLLAIALLFATVTFGTAPAGGSGAPTALAVAAGGYHTCVLLSNGNVDCYGSNDWGQAEDYLGGDAIGVAAGGFHTCVLRNNGTVDCYGYNSDGRAEDYVGGDAIGVAAYYHTCVLRSNGTVDCYGHNWDGQATDYLGGDAIAVAAGYRQTCVLQTGGNVDCYGYDGFYDYGQFDDYLAGNATGVATGGAHTCVLTADGNVDCTGYNSHGQAEDYLGGDAVDVVTGPAHTCVLRSGGNVDCYGNNHAGHAEDYLGGDAIGVSTGDRHTCVLLAAGTVDCYGSNDAGQSVDWPAVPPTLTLPGNLTVEATSKDGANVTYAATAVDADGNPLTPSCAAASGTLFAPGTSTVTCTATDANGLTAAGSFDVTVRFGWSGFLAPVQDGGEYAQGRNLRVGFELTGASAGITDLEARLYVAEIAGGTVGPESPAPSKSSSGGLFVYEDGRYAINVDTKALPAGTYRLRADLGDGEFHAVTILLEQGANAQPGGAGRQAP